MKEMAVKRFCWNLLPFELEQLWLKFLKELSSFVMAFIWQSPNPSVLQTGMSTNLRSDFFSVFSQVPECFRSVKSKTGLERGFGSRKVCEPCLHHLCFHIQKAKGRYSDIFWFAVSVFV